MPLSIHDLIRREKDPSLYYVYVMARNVITSHGGHTRELPSEVYAQRWGMSKKTLLAKLEKLTKEGFFERDIVQDGRKTRYFYRLVSKNYPPRAQKLPPNDDDVYIHKDIDIREKTSSLRGNTEQSILLEKNGVDAPIRFEFDHIPVGVIAGVFQTARAKKVKSPIGWAITQLRAWDGVAEAEAVEPGYQDLGTMSNEEWNEYVRRWAK